MAKRKRISAAHDDTTQADDETEVKLRAPGGVGFTFRGKQFILTNIMLLLGTITMALLVLVMYLHRDETKQSNAILVEAITKTTEAQGEMNYIMTLSEQDRVNLNIQMPPSLRAKIR